VPWPEAPAPRGGTNGPPGLQKGWSQGCLRSLRRQHGGGQSAHQGSPMLGEEGKGKGREGSGGRKRDTFARAPSSFRTDRGSGGTLAHVHRCTVQGREVAGDSLDTGRRCSSHAASVLHSGSETGIARKGRRQSRWWWCRLGELLSELMEGKREEAVEGLM
jgi:hypothetical protein